jgi:hypothetical protein
MSEENQETITLILVSEDENEENIEVELTIDQYTEIVWHAGRSNMNVEDFISQVLSEELKNYSEEE